MELVQSYIDLLSREPGTTVVQEKGINHLDKLVKAKSPRRYNISEDLAQYIEWRRRHTNYLDKRCR